jgi:LCP family protein required for cell wall assembly
MATMADSGSASSGGTPPLARHGRLPRARPLATVAKALAAVLAVVLASGAGVAGIAVWSLTSSLKPSVSLPNDTPGPEAKPVPEIGAIDGGVNLLLSGSDSGEGDPAFGERGEHLSDVTILLHIAQDHSSATVVSFPRDLLVEMPACPATPDGTGPGTNGGFVDKLNASLSYGGLGCVVATVQSLTGLTIPFAAEIEFNGVVEMSNAVGGVPVCVAEEIQDAHTGTFLSPGEHVLQGIDALQFLRTRHGLRDGSDLARIGNQQAFLSSLVRVIKSDGTLRDPIKLYGLARAAANNMVLSDQLQSPDRMVSIALALRDIDLDKVAFLQYPVAWTSSGSIEPIRDDAAVLFNALAADVPVALSGQLGQANEPAPAPPAPPVPAPTTSDVPTDAPTSTATPPSDLPTDVPVTPATPTAPPAVQLPASVSGQTAAQQTCSVGRTLREQ